MRWSCCDVTSECPYGVGGCKQRWHLPPQMDDEYRAVVERTTSAAAVKARKEAEDEAEMIKWGRQALRSGSESGSGLDEQTLEVCILDRRKEGRKFVRLSSEEVKSLLEA